MDLVKICRDTAEDQGGSNEDNSSKKIRFWSRDRWVLMDGLKRLEFLDWKGMLKWYKW